MMTIKLGEFTVPAFDTASVAFGASADQYPRREDIPEEHRHMRSPECRLFDDMFFSGKPMLGRKMRDGFDQKEFATALAAYMRSFAPKHEVKSATCGWLIDVCTEVAA